MFYGIILESARDGVILFYGEQLWKRIVQELQLPSETFALFQRYDHKVLFNICECMADILHDGTAETYLEFFGQDFVRYFVNFGFDKILRIAGRTLRDFLFAIDQLHDSNRFTFPHMSQPLFHVTEENQMGATLDYKSVRHGFARYAIGGLVAAAKTLFQENIKMNIIHDLSTKEYAHIIFWVEFQNQAFEQKRLSNFPSLSDVNGATFFRVFPFSILMDSRLHIHQMGEHIMKVFPDHCHLIGRPLDDVFRLIRPDIHVEWDKILSYGRHIVFLMENRLPLRTGSSGRIYLKGQMKYLENKNLLWYLCHPVLGCVTDMISAGLYLNDLNLFDGTSELLITGIHQEREIEDAIVNQEIYFGKLQQSNNDLIQWYKKSERLLDSILPKHVARMLQSGVQTNSICESHSLVTILFAYITDLPSLTVHLDPIRVIQCLNEIVDAFDQVKDNYDVFRVVTKADTSYMLVSGLKDRSHLVSCKRDGRIPSSPTNENRSELHQTEIIASLALDLLDVSEQIVNPVTNEPFKIKFGFHTGPAVGGIIGEKNIQYCLFGATVNMASQIASTSQIGRIHLSHSSYTHLAMNNRFTMENAMKSKGTNSTYWLLSKAKKSLSTVINKTSSQVKCPFSGEFIADHI